MSVRVPDWLAPLAAAAAAARSEELSRFLPPADGRARPSAVLIALSQTRAGPGVLLIERAATLRTHAGQAAFPGGAADPDDTDPAATALREAAEEVGIRRSTVEVLATLPALFLPPSGFMVTPVIGWWAQPHPVAVVDALEVASVTVVPVAELANPANRFQVAHPSGFQGPGFAAGGMFVWGFTAGLLDAVLRLAGWARPWDRQQFRPLPTAALGNVSP
ncbi:MAG: CoA pyrophosphatase [Actinomycetota bacterium]